MNKNTSVELYRRLVSDLRNMRSDIAISCDMLLGFPGEEDEHFKHTMEFLKYVEPVKTHIFTFSPRDNTPFSGMKIKGQHKFKDRYALLRDLTEELSLCYKRRFLNRHLHLITEEKESGLTKGYTENYIRVSTDEDLPLGKILPVVITKIEKDSVFARYEKN